MSISLKTTVDNTLQVLEDIKKLSKLDVLVGIPEETTDRANNEEGDVTNAQLVAWHTKGVMKSSMKREVEESVATGSTYNEAQSMYISSHGSPLWKIPPRPIIEPAIVASGNKERLAEDLRIAGKLHLDGDKEKAIEALHVAGLDATNMVKAWWEDPRNNWDPLSERTIKAKEKKSGKSGSHQILVDSGQLRKAITYVVNTEEGES